MSDLIDRKALIVELKDWLCIYPPAVRRAIRTAPSIVTDEDLIAIKAAIHIMENRYPSEVIYTPRDRMGKRTKIGGEWMISYKDAAKRLRDILTRCGETGERSEDNAQTD